eukprot:Sro69_g038591.1  (168) ;mRNA; f:69620-70123
MLQATEMTHKSCFLTFAYLTPSHNVLVPLAPPAYAPKDYLMIVDIRTMDDQILFSKAIPGNDIPEFFSEGEIESIHLQETILGFHNFKGSFSSYQQFYDVQFPPHRCLNPRLIGAQWKGTVHLMRLPDRKVIQLVEVPQCDEEMGPQKQMKTKAKFCNLTIVVLIQN